MKRIPGLLFILLISVVGSAQTYQFFNYNTAEGLCDKFAYTLNQDADGFLWVGTTQGLCRFDGTSFDQEFSGDTIPVSIAHTSMLDSRGRLWFGHENGLISVLDGDEFRVVSPSDDFRTRISAIREDSAGNILVLCQQSGVLVVNPELEIIFEGDPANPDDPFTGKFLYTFQVTPEGHLLAGTSDGISIFRYDRELEIYIETGQIEELRYLPVQELVPGLQPNEYWVGTEDEGLFRLTGEGFDPNAYRAVKIGSELGLEYAKISSIEFDGNRRVWVTDYGVGIHRLELDAAGNPVTTFLFDAGSGIPNAYINEIFIDEEGNQWFSSQGNGIAVLRDQAFTFLQVWEDEDSPDVRAVHLEDGEQWYGGFGRIVRIDNEQVTYLKGGQGVPEDWITAIHRGPRGALYIGTERSGLHILEPGSSRVIPLVISRNSLENIVNAIDGNEDSIFVATNNGVYSYHPGTKRRISKTTANGLPHNKINDVLVDSEGAVWVATITSGIFSLNSEKQFWIKGKPKLEMICLMEAEPGVIWAGTDGNGVYKFDLNSDTLRHYTAEDGLINDYTYAIGSDPKGYIWVGHREGISRIDPTREHIRIFGKESGFTSDILHRSLDMDTQGKLFFGSTEGVIRYDAYQAREDTIPPRLSLKSLLINDTPFDPTQDITLKYDRYEIRIDFVGINFSNPEQVHYQYKLENYQDDWSDFSKIPFAFYPRVEDGNYTFMLRACDGNGNCSEEPLNLGITVKIPIWKAWWFIVSLVVVMLATIFIVFKIRERNQKAIQEYLQRQLDERTREVIQQKEEIEIKNRDITDSINYAQRIQASILPSIQKLHQAFTGSFVFYQPRDIVSGDFYWYEKIGDNRFIVVCADSTGHGVPGAFMSMIGTTLIKDICLRSGVQKPSQVLTTLDNEVREALNQNQETSGSNDGMDIIVAEVDMKTHRFTVSSAMRPVIIYSGDEQIYVKGSRSSVGGQLDEDRVEKDFIDQEFQLKKGDIIYMFSDGYPDQFGGPLGRKFKTVRLKNLLRDIHDKPMDEQYNYIKSNFFLWKEDLEQVDDVLFMGIKL